MNRNEFMLVGCGGAGGKLVDTIMEDPRFLGFFINTSHTDLESLKHYDEIDKNFMCIGSNNNGMGRDRKLGKRVASKNGYNILEKLQGFDSKIVYLVTSFGGGSGSSIVSSTLKAVKQLKEDGDFDKIINLIGILPKLDSSTDILKNTIDTWNEIFSYNCVNNMIFIDNNNTIDGRQLSEDEINESFSELFNRIFEIPNVNGRNFDTGNLSKILNDKGCMYIYDLNEEYETINEAFKDADSNSVLAKMYKTKENTIVDEEGNSKIICGYVGTSFNNEEFNHEDVLCNYHFLRGEFTGYNEFGNIALISGCLPPFLSIQVINAELEDRAKISEKINSTDFSKFVIRSEDIVNEVASTSIKKTKEKPIREKSKKMKKILKKNLFDDIYD